MEMFLFWTPENKDVELNVSSFGTYVPISLPTGKVFALDRGLLIGDSKSPLSLRHLSYLLARGKHNYPVDTP